MQMQREQLESERMMTADLHRQEVRELRQALESLRKEIDDRQMLIESQGEKIADMNRELGHLRVSGSGHRGYMDRVSVFHNAYANL